MNRYDASHLLFAILLAGALEFILIVMFLRTVGVEWERILYGLRSDHPVMHRAFNVSALFVLLIVMGALTMRLITLFME